MPDGQPVYRGPIQTDARDLPPLARRIFTDTFGHLFDAQKLSDFCDAAYGPQGTMIADLRDASIRWRVAEAGGELIAYAKIRPLAAPAPDPKPGAMELQQIYVLRDWHGKGVAEELMRWSVDLARQQGAPELYLTVFDHNERAKRFYAKHGFSEVGRCTFVLGDQIHDDRVWRRPL